MRAPRWPLWPFEIPGKPHAGLCAAKATARATEPPRLSDHNERRTFTMATETVPNICKGTVPYDDASESSALMFDTLTLLHSLLDMAEDGGKALDREGLTSKESRMVNLLIQASDKTAAAIRALNL